ncbi:MAG: IS1595 family transposase [Proteobacteria bacterium]|nr:IS1595 family transposase [Pseudomonadota bacterium]
MNITNPIFHDEIKARKHLETLRWADGPFCPRCGGTKVTRLKGKAEKLGQLICNPCRKKFTVTVGTLFERSHIPLHKWIFAFHLMAASKKGISAHQLHRMLGITYKSAWFMAHRIREAMREVSPSPLGGEGKTVEVDETFVGRKRGRKKVAGVHHKMAVLTLLERGGKARSFHVKNATLKGIMPVLRIHLNRESAVMTDDATYYRNLYMIYKSHDAVAHSRGEYGRGEIHTNTIEGFFSIFKRGMRGVYQHCAEHHLHRYLSEFDFRYNHHRITDWERTSIALKGIEGKRLTYRRVA